MKSIEQQARAVAAQRWSGKHIPSHDVTDGIVDALSRAGLLVTERDVLCRKLAEPLSKLPILGTYVSTQCGKTTVEFTDHAAAIAFHDAVSAIRIYDREHAPKPRYTVEDIYVKDTQKGVIVGMGDSAQNATMCAALNALAEKEGGR